MPRIGNSSASGGITVSNFPSDFPDAEAISELSSVLNGITIANTTLTNIVNATSDTADNTVNSHTDAQAVLAALGEINAFAGQLAGGVTIAHVTAPLTIANLPVTQAVTFSVISGSVTISNPSSSITVNNFPATQVITAPSGITINNAVFAVTGSGFATTSLQNGIISVLAEIDGNLADGSQLTQLVDGSANPVGVAANAITVTVTNPSTATSDSTATNQATEIARLSSILFAVTSQVATAAAQATASSNLLTLHADLGHMTDGTQRAIPVNAGNVPLFTAANAATVHVDNMSTATSDSTAANQSTEIAKLSSLIFAVTGTTATAAAQATQTTAINLQSASMATLHTDLLALENLVTNSTQQTRVTNGTNVADVTAGGIPGQNAQVVVGAFNMATFSTTSATAVATLDCGSYRDISLQITQQGGSSTATFQTSNDLVAWSSQKLMLSSATNGAPSTFTNGTGIFRGTLDGRYFRLNVTSIVSGTTSGTVVALSPGAASAGTTGGVQSPADALAPSASATAATVFPEGYNGATWDKLRVASVLKTATATASGNTAVWTPTSSKKFRLMGFEIVVTGASVTVPGVLEVNLQDSTSNTGAAYSLSLTATALAGSFSTGPVLIGNGLLSATPNNVLNINLSAALITGEVRVMAWGVEE